MAEPAPHPRAQIRAAVVEALEGVDELSAAVSARLHAFPTDRLPAAAVYTLRETSARDTIPSRLRRSLDLVVDLHLTATADLDDAADALCLAVEAALAADPTFGRRALESFLRETTVGLSGEGENRVGLARLTYTVTYRTTPAGSRA